MHTWEFLPEELIDDEFDDRRPRPPKKKDIDADLTIVNVVKNPEEAGSVTIPAPRPGDYELVHVSTVVDPSAPSKGRTTPDKPLSFSKDDLDRYVAHRKTRLAAKSVDWLNRASQALWESTQGEISQGNITALRNSVLNKYASIDSHRKVLGFATAFLKHLAKTRFDPRYQSFDVYLELPKTTRVRKAVTERIITRENIAAALRRIDAAES